MSSRSGPLTRQVRRLLLLAGLLAVVIVTGSAHAPLETATSGGITNATLIDSPEKSFAIYAALPDDGDAGYFRFPLKKGQVLSGSLQVPGPDSPVPDLVIIGPGIAPSGMVPSALRIPAGYGARAVQGKPPGMPSYEPFSPQPVYEAGRFNVTASRDGDYYIAVTGPAGGKYGLAPGFREEFTAAEWVTIPWSVIAIHLWKASHRLRSAHRWCSL